MRARGAWQATAASLWLLSISASAAADPTSDAESTTAVVVASSSTIASSATTGSASETSSSAPASTTDSAPSETAADSAKPWDTAGDGQRLEFKIATPGQLEWPAEKRGTMQRAIGYVVGGLGVVGLAASGVFGYRAFDSNARALDQCRSPDPNQCTGDGKDSRDMAKAFAGGAVISLAAGAALLFSGIALIAHAPKRQTSHALVSDLRLSALPSLKGANFRLVGAW